MKSMVTLLITAIATVQFAGAFMEQRSPVGVVSNEQGFGTSRAKTS
jgi:hypothetical protein